MFNASLVVGIRDYASARTHSRVTGAAPLPTRAPGAATGLHERVGEGRIVMDGLYRGRVSPTPCGEEQPSPVVYLGGYQSGVAVDPLAYLSHLLEMSSAFFFGLPLLRDQIV